jgi:predicted small lipoprotein YifL
MVVMANRMKMKAIGLTLLAVFILTACGQKRALYLLEEPVTNNTIPDSVPSTEPTEQGKN